MALVQASRPGCFVVVVVNRGSIACRSIAVLWSKPADDLKQRSCGPWPAICCFPWHNHARCGGAAGEMDRIELLR